MGLIFSAEKFKDIDSILGTFLVFNKDGEIIYSSEEAKAMLMYDETIVGTQLKKLFPSLINGISDFDDLFSIIKKEKYANVYRMNGTIFSVRLILNKIEQGIYGLRILNMSDEVEWKQRYERAQLDAKATLSKQNEFVANITHELRTPVNGIKGNVRFLVEKGGLTKEQEETLSIVTTCCINMEKIINNLLDYAKMDAGKLSIEKEKFSFRELMKQVRETNAKQANQKGISLLFNIEDSIPDELYGDALRIGQILNNFISNAVKFTSIGSVKVQVVEVARTAKNIELFFMIIDTGIGIAKENIDKLFSSFTQVDGSITRTYGGTGLGLAICKQLVGMMKGSIKVESELGKGSTFAFSVVIGLTPDKEEEEEIVEIIEEDTSKTESLQNRFEQLINKVQRQDVGKVFVWGSPENKAEIKDVLSKLVLCIEMGSFEKAEMFSEKIKKLCEGGGMDYMKQIFKLQLAIRNSDYDRSMQEYNGFLNIFEKD